MHHLKTRVIITPMPMTNVEIKRNGTENALGVLRRFSRKMQESGIIMKVKGERYAIRPLSKLAEKNMKVKRLARRVEVEKLKKLGKM
ncbi:MAG: seg [Candidatus Nomurabacteria bacterium]|nr:seg [Candidatus Nomurabacteria bacterium]